MLTDGSRKAPMDREPVPSAILTRLLEAAKELEEWAVGHRQATLAEHERAVLRIFRSVMGPTLGAVLERALQLDQAAATVVATQEPAEPVEAAPELLVAEIDELQVRFEDGWHEAKVGEIAGCQVCNGLPSRCGWLSTPKSSIPPSTLPSGRSKSS